MIGDIPAMWDEEVIEYLFKNCQQVILSGYFLVQIIKFILQKQYYWRSYVFRSGCCDRRSDLTTWYTCARTSTHSTSHKFSGCFLSSRWQSISPPMFRGSCALLRALTVHRLCYFWNLHSSVHHPSMYCGRQYCYYFGTFCYSKFIFATKSY